jgi:hypothetical protein
MSINFRCPCKGRNGEVKKLYATETAARDTAYYRQRESGETLRVYPCPSGKGYHLTKTPGNDALPRNGTNWIFEID